MAAPSVSSKLDSGRAALVIFSLMTSFPPFAPGDAILIGRNYNRHGGVENTYQELRGGRPARQESPPLMPQRNSESRG